MMPLWLALIIVLAVAVAAGAVASVVGFGIGSLLTPLLALQIDLKVAVAVVSIPHLAGTALRFWMLRGHVDRRVLLSFGVMSAAGGLAGAYLGTFLDSPVLTAILGLLLIFAGASGLTGLADRMRLAGPAAWTAGALSGLFGGLVGNQGGIRSAALLGFQLPKDAFVATATAVALMVDGARMPIYLATQWRDIAAVWPYVAAATVGTVVGTLIGQRILGRIPEATFRKLVAGVVLVLGLAMLAAAIRSLAG